ncbi:hypothetical protein [Bradyrhizobium sp.]|uniref:hypothetical protein n=1 Tax=Bradyrhizobium sp. TaxID=376 RepID=UPI0025C05C13|nr:hypothetical protein [Bradyrhizobium sp.]
MEINGKRVVDATKPIAIHITKRDTTDGDNKNPSSCAAARAVKREIPDCVNARVHIGRVYVETPKQWVRYNTPDALRTEIIAFDRGGSFAPGEYKLQVPEKRDYKKTPSGTQWNGGNRGKPAKKRAKLLVAKIKRHEVAGVRPKGANR